MGAPRSAPDNDLLTGAATLRISVEAQLGSATVGGELGGGAFGPVTLQLLRAKAKLVRAPLDLGLRAGIRRGRVELDGDLGLMLALETVSGVGLSSNQHASGLDVGLRVAALLRIWAHARVAPTLGIDAQVVPSPYRLVVTSVGTVGTLPRLWLGAWLGLSVKLH